VRLGTELVSSAAVGLDVVRTIEAVDRSLDADGLPVALDDVVTGARASTA